MSVRVVANMGRKTAQLINDYTDRHEVEEMFCKDLPDDAFVLPGVPLRKRFTRFQRENIEYLRRRLVERRDQDYGLVDRLDMTQFKLPYEATRFPDGRLFTT